MNTLLPIKKASGFTFIELLIVIAIIGILVVIVLVSIRSVQQKTQNTRVRNDVRQLRLLAEEVFDNAGANYLDWTTNPVVVNQIQTLRDDISKVNHETNGQNATSVLIDTRPDEYCVSGKLLLPENGANYFCVDTSAVFRLSHTPCADNSDLTQPLVCPN